MYLTITTYFGSKATENFIIVSQNTKSDYSITYVGDGIYIDRCKSKKGVV